ncbi:pilus assembly protein TadG-related protein [Roseomonas sp. 18066]|uniref:pilus assembly protein TadG-related protein n=1 Tax=Roseomonas sp. 18066 TaxID=2681412 RepID=UPI001356F41E|nr:pilus assembly protein TadG-related protein [Roseomonas sp. 18066]
MRLRPAILPRLRRPEAALRAVLKRAARRMTRGDDSGAVGLLAALCLASMMGFGALAVDMTALHFGKRALQAAADAAALSAVRAPANATLLAGNTLRRQGMADVAFTATAGRYDDSLAAPGSRFSAAATPLGAVRVEASRVLPLGLMRVLLAQDSVTLRVSATAAHQQLGAFTLSSTTAALDAGLLNAMIGGMLGGSLNLSLLAWNGLATARLSPVALLDQLALQLGVGTYAALLTSRVSLPVLLTAAGQVLAASAPAAAATLASLAATADAARGALLGDVIDLGVMQGREAVASLVSATPFANATLSALELLRAAAVMGGGHAAQLTTLGTVAGALISARVMAIAPPATAPAPPAEGALVLGPVGSRAATTQIRLLLQIALPQITIPLVGTVTVANVGVLVQVAPASGVLSAVSCGDDPVTDTAISVLARSGLASVQLGSVNAMRFADSASVPPVAPATLLAIDTGLISIGATAATRAPVVVAEGSGTLRFTAAQIAAHTPQSISSGGALGSLLSGLAGNLQITAAVNVLGGSLVLTPTVVTAALAGVLDPVLRGLDPLLANLLAALGLRLGIAEVTPEGARCGVPTLVL